MKHKCTIKNELDQTCEIENSMWIYDSNNEFIGDFEIRFCPQCGVHIEAERAVEELMKVSQELGLY